MIVSSALLTLAVPAAFVSPVIADVLIAASLPVHIAVGVSHVIHDYLPNWPAEMIARILAAIVFLGLLRMILSGVGIVTGVLGTLWDEAD
jgi:succinate dehydrogenase hydrophobic anchor subunit